MTLRADIAGEVIAKVNEYVIDRFGLDALDGRPSLRLVIQVAAMIASLTLDVREKMNDAVDVAEREIKSGGGT